jgi:T5SS/PEP-CTERM-associated repeat protein
VGSGGPGTLTIENGGAINSAGLTVGAGAGGSGTMTVQSGGAATSVGALTVGGSGAGTLTIQSGGVVSIAGGVQVGSGFQGTLTIQSGGVVSGSSDINIGRSSNAPGIVTVDGAGSQLTNSGVLRVGSGGAGTLTVQNGGLASSSVGVFIGNFGSTGTATVTGAGSQLNSAGQLVVGTGGPGTLTIQSDGVVSSGSAGTFIGNAGNVGTVTVDGAGSQLNTSGELTVGAGGPGALTVQNGGVVSSQDTRIGIDSGSTGTLTVNGLGSQLNNTAELDIGFGGEGTLSVTDGGTVGDAVAIVGTSAGSNGSVLVDAGTWTTTGSLTIGSAGAGEVTVQDGGVLSAGSIIIGSSGSLVVDPEVVNVPGSFTLMPNGLLTLDIAGLTPDLTSQLDIGGNGLFEGTIDFEFIDGFAPTTGESFDLINIMGTADFSETTFEIGGLAPGFEYTDTLSGGEFTLTAQNDGESTTPEPSSMWLVGTLLIIVALGALKNRLEGRI